MRGLVTAFIAVAVGLISVSGADSGTEAASADSTVTTEQE